MHGNSFLTALTVERNDGKEFVLGDDPSGARAGFEDFYCNINFVGINLSGMSVEFYDDEPGDNKVSCLVSVDTGSPVIKPGLYGKPVTLQLSNLICLDGSNDENKEIFSGIWEFNYNLNYGNHIRFLESNNAVESVNNGCELIINDCVINPLGISLEMKGNGIVDREKFTYHWDYNRLRAEQNGEVPDEEKDIITLQFADGTRESFEMIPGNEGSSFDEGISHMEGKVYFSKVINPYDIKAVLFNGIQITE